MGDLPILARFFSSALMLALLLHDRVLHGVASSKCSHAHIRQHLQTPESSNAVFVKIKHIFRYVQKGKIGYSSAPLSPLSNVSRINIL
jgi:hypothetical protein